MCFGYFWGRFGACLSPNFDKKIGGRGDALIRDRALNQANTVYGFKCVSKI